MRHKTMTKIINCKGCNRPITTLINPILATKVMQDKYSGYCSNCMPEDLSGKLREDYHNLLQDKIKQGGI